MNLLEALKLCMLENKKIKICNEKDGYFYWKNGYFHYDGFEYSSLSHNAQIFSYLEKYFKGLHYEFEIYKETFGWEKASQLLKEERCVTNPGLELQFLKLSINTKSIYLHDSHRYQYWRPFLNDFERQDWYEVFPESKKENE